MGHHESVHKSAIAKKWSYTHSFHYDLSPTEKLLKYANYVLCFCIVVSKYYTRCKKKLLKYANYVSLFLYRDKWCPDILVQKFLIKKGGRLSPEVSDYIG